MARHSSWSDDDGATTAVKAVGTATEVVDVVKKVANSPISEGLKQLGVGIGKWSTKKTKKQTEEYNKRASRVKKVNDLLEGKLVQDAEKQAQIIKAIQKNNIKIEKDEQTKIIVISSVVLIVGIGIVVVLNKIKNSQQS